MQLRGKTGFTSAPLLLPQLPLRERGRTRAAHGRSHRPLSLAVCLVRGRLPKLRALIRLDFDFNLLLMQIICQSICRLLPILSTNPPLKALRKNSSRGLNDKASESHADIVLLLKWPALMFENRFKTGCRVECLRRGAEGPIAERWKNRQSATIIISTAP